MQKKNQREKHFNKFIKFREKNKIISQSQKRIHNLFLSLSLCFSRLYFFIYFFLIRADLEPIKLINAETKRQTKRRRDI
jgi:hypothetical protein